MIAIYARQSVDRPDSISIDSQIELCRHEARGQEYRVYADRGYSGKDIQRPQLQRLLADLKQGHIQRVIVYKLDRISRSVIDFANLMDLLESCGAAFVSASERFDTSTPMGRAMLHICVVFAQLERETIQKRVADAYQSRCSKGLYMGGPLPYGFRREALLIDGIHSSRYAPEPEEADTVRLIYRLCGQEGLSCGEAARRLNQLGLVNRRGRPWDRSRLRELLRNPIYARCDRMLLAVWQAEGAEIAELPWEPGCGCYSYRQPNGGRLLVPAPHQGLIEPELWLSCQENLRGRQQPQPAQAASRTWLAGKLKCGCCGRALADKGQRVHYLYCSRRLEGGDCPGPGCLPTSQVEDIVGRELEQRLLEWGALSAAPEKPGPELGRLRSQLLELEAESGALAARLSQAEGPLLTLMEQRAGELEQRRQGLARELRLLEEAARRSRPRIICRPGLWQELPPAARAKAAGLLLRAVRISQERIILEWRL